MRAPTSMTISRSEEWRRCGAPGCARRIKTAYFCCGQHRSLLGFELNADLQTAWGERQFDLARFNQLKAKALRAWGWEPETLMVGKAAR
jgi:hypothetical protein